MTVFNKILFKDLPVGGNFYFITETPEGNQLLNYTKLNDTTAHCISVRTERKIVEFQFNAIIMIREFYT